jgi:nucleoside-diphosphate-sugar epimerase
VSAILITGASGQVGGALVEELLRRGAKTRAMDELAFIASAYGGGVGETVTDVVRRFGGSEPRTFGGFANEHADHFAGGLSHHM